MSLVHDEPVRGQPAQKHPAPLAEAVWRGPCLELSSEQSSRAGAGNEKAAAAS